jgi:internalin A
VIPVSTTLAVLFAASTATVKTPTDLRAVLASPQGVEVLTLEGLDVPRLPPGLGTVSALRDLRLRCLEQLAELPAELGELRALERLDIDNGNGCSMNVTLPPAIAQLTKLRVLILYGALDARHPTLKTAKTLPPAVASLSALEELDLGRNQMRQVPVVVGMLANLRVLKLDYNELRRLPPFVGGALTKLRELHLSGNGRITLPDTLTERAGLKIWMGNDALTLADQAALRRRFPSATFDFTNEFDDGNANEEARKN